jgi:putative restriction endonuclease
MPDREITFVDAAHLLPFSISRNDHPSNGLALCKNHHWALDQHLIAPDPDGIWQISRLLDSRRSLGERELAGLRDKPLLTPIDSAYAPLPEGLQWRYAHLLA